MLKGGILNPDLNYHISQVSHFDPVLVCDAGMPIAKGTDRVDLEFVPGVPEIAPVVEKIVEKMPVQEVYIAKEIAQASPELYKEYERIFKDVAEIKYIPYLEFKKMSESSRVAVKTGEFCYHYSSIIIIAGCAY